MKFLNLVELLDEIDAVPDYGLDIQTLALCAIPVIIVLVIISIVKSIKKKKEQNKNLNQ